MFCCQSLTVLDETVNETSEALTLDLDVVQGLRASARLDRSRGAAAKPTGHAYPAPTRVGNGPLSLPNLAGQVHASAPTCEANTGLDVGETLELALAVTAGANIRFGLNRFHT